MKFTNEQIRVCDELERYFHEHGERLKLPSEINGTIMLAAAEFALAYCSNRTECGNGCGYQEPYGFVPEADCSVHDAEVKCFGYSDNRKFKCVDHGIFSAIGYDNPVFLADTVANCPRCGVKCWEAHESKK